MKSISRNWKRNLTLVVLLSAIVLALRIIFWHPLPLEGELPRDGFVRVPGVVHIHTTHSDGGGTPEEVVSSARRAGASFAIITDHGNLDAKPTEGYHDGTLLLVGAELSTHGGHIAGLRIPDPAFRFSSEADQVLEDVRDLGGFSFATHPLSVVNAFRWTGWDLPGPWGMEILNGDSEWRSAGYFRLVKTIALYGLNRRYALLTSMVSPAPALEKWDGLLRQRNVVGLAGSDAHSRIPIGKKGGIRFPSYESIFSVMQNHVLLDAPLSGRRDSDADAILTALSRGRFYMGLDALAPANEFYFDALCAGQKWTMGDTVSLRSGLVLTAGGRIPQDAEVVLLRDGKVVLQAQHRIELSPVPQGVYRVEVRVPGWTAPWVLSNPIYVFDNAGSQARAARAEWTREPEPPSTAMMLDAFEGHTIFEAVSDPLSSVNKNVFDPGAGPDGAGAGRFEFHLGTPTPDHPDIYCGFVNMQPRDFSGKSGLVFSIKGDGMYRTWLQIRDRNPKSTDESTEWWFASVRATPEWRRVAVPFSTLRSINKHSDGHLDPDKVVGVLFVIDRAAMKPGSSGVIWISNIGVY
jgi:hypothetical protein